MKSVSGQSLRVFSRFLTVPPYQASICLPPLGGSQGTSMCNRTGMLSLPATLKTFRHLGSSSSIVNFHSPQILMFYFMEAS